MNTIALAEKLKNLNPNDDFITIGIGAEKGSGRRVVNMLDGTELPGIWKEFVAAHGGHENIDHRGLGKSLRLKDRDWYIQTDFHTIQGIYLRK